MSRYCRERDELNATVSNLQMLVNQLRDKEASATLKVKRSLDVVDQAHFDKNQVMDIVRIPFSNCLSPCCGLKLFRSMVHCLWFLNWEN